MSTPDIDILKLLDAGVSLAEILRQIRSPAEEEMRRRCALVRSFDLQIYEMLSAQLEECPEFEMFVQQPDIQAVPRQASTYTLCSTERDRYLEQWTNKEHYDEWRRWNNKIAAFYEQRRPADLLNRLYHLIPGQHKKAINLFEHAFSRFNRQFQLEYLYGLLAILDERTAFLGEELAELRDRKRQEYQSRALFIQPYYQTATYYRRDRLLQHVKALLNTRPNAPWIWHLYATGGMGKTMFLNWLIARWLIPEKQIPCARIDLDFIPLSTVARYPWLLLLPIAEQLNQQIAREPFLDIINGLRDYSNLLNSAITFLEPFDLREISTLEAEIGAELSDRLGLALQSAGVKTPIVIVLDTLEDATILHSESLLRLIQEIQKLHEYEPRIRLILSGRYNVAERIQEYNAEFGAQTAIYELERFRPGEAEQYLQQRGLHDSTLISAIVDRAEGNPFKLTLFAELALIRADLTPEIVRAYPHTDYAYLLERVIKRIPDQRVRWLIRYGVVPRHLTQPFIQDVMLPYLETALAGETAADQPKVLPVGLEHYQDQELWIPEAANLDPADLWNALVNYVSSHGWLSMDQPGLLRFHPEVIQPMRNLLRQQPVAQRLHASSVNYFEHRAESNPDRWSEYICEAIYHKFQLEGIAAADYWRAKLNAPQAQSSPSVRLRIAQEIVGKEYAVAEQEPLPTQNGQSIVTIPLLIEAHYETTNALISSSSETFASKAAEWQEANRHLAIAENLQEQITDCVSRPIGITRLIAENYQQEGRYDEAIEVLESAINRVTQAEDRFNLHLALADTLAMMRREEATHGYQTALSLHQPEFEVPIWQIRERLSAWYLLQGQLQYVLDQYQMALSESEAHHPSVARYFRRLSVELYLRIGDLASAQQLVQQLRQSETRDRTILFESALLEAELLLAALNPVEALRYSQEALDVAQSPIESAVAHDLQARILAALMDYPRALQHLERTKSYYREAGSITGPDRCHFLNILFHVRDLGSFAQANTLIHKIQSRTAGRLQDAELWVQVQVLRLIVLDRKVSEDAAPLFRDMCTAENPPLNPHQRSRLLMIGLALGLLDPRSERCWAELIENLEAIPIPSARLELLDTLQWRVDRLPLNSDQIRQLRHLFSVPPEDTIEFLPQALLRAELDRVISNDTTLLRTVLEKCLTSVPQNLATIAQVLRFYDRLSEAALKAMPAIPIEQLRQSEVYERFPLLSVVILIEEGLRLFHHEEFARLSQLLHEVRQLIETVPTTSQWFAKQKTLEAEVAASRQQFAQYTNLQRTAINLFERSGNRREAARLSETNFKSPLLDRSLTTELVRQKAVTVSLTPSSRDVWQILFEFEGLPIAPVQQQIDIRPLSQLLASNQIRSLQDVVKLLYTSWQDVIDDLAHILLLPIHRQLDPEEVTCDIKLCLSPGWLLSSIPWEWVQRASNLYHIKSGYFYRTSNEPSLSWGVVAWMQDALNQVISNLDLPVDCIYGGRTAGAVQRFQEQFGIQEEEIFDRLRERVTEPLQTNRLFAGQVLVIQPELYDETSDSLGYRGSGSSLMNLYEQEQIEPLQLMNPDLEQLRASLEQSKPQVVHIVGVMKEVRSEIMLDFARKSRELRETSKDKTMDGWSPHEFCRMFEFGYRKTKPPVLILEIARPSSDAEALRQLLLRNLFASELFQLDAFAGILATGLQPVYTKQQQTQIYIRGMRRGAALGEIAREIQQTTLGSELDTAIAMLGTALFTREPRLPLIMGSFI